MSFFYHILSFVYIYFTYTNIYLLLSAIYLMENMMTDMRYTKVSSCSYPRGIVEYIRADKGV
jgi:hypothetical protein